MAYLEGTRGSEDKDRRRFAAAKTDRTCDGEDEVFVPREGDSRRLRAQSCIETSARDQVLLSFIAEQRFVLTEHVQALLRISRSAANKRLRGLRSARLLIRDPGTYRLPYHAITRRGLAQIDSDLPPPRPDSSVYWHDIGVAWIWLAARAGKFGPLEEIVSERTMRSHDGAATVRPNR